MATLFNDQRVLGVVLLNEADSQALYNNQPVTGVVDAGAALFGAANFLRTLGVDVLTAGTLGIHNEQQVVGVVLITNGRTLYNNRRVVPVTAVSGSLA